MKLNEVATELKKQQERNAVLINRKAALEARRAAIGAGRAKLLTMLAAGNGNSAKGLDVVESDLRRLEQEREGVAMLIAESEGKVISLARELEEAERAQAESRRQAQLMKLETSASTMANDFCQTFTALVTLLGQLSCTLGELNQGRPLAAQAIAERLIHLNYLLGAGWRLCGPYSAWRFGVQPMQAPVDSKEL